MKHQHETSALRNKIMKYFILCSLGVDIANSAIDSTFDDIIAPMLYPTGTDYKNYDLPHFIYITNFIYIAVSIAAFVIGALIFYKLAAKALRHESERRVKEQNLLYAAIAHDLKTPWCIDIL